MVTNTPIFSAHLDSFPTTILPMMIRDMIPMACMPPVETLRQTLTLMPRWQTTLIKRMFRHLRSSCLAPCAMMVEHTLRSKPMALLVPQVHGLNISRNLRSQATLVKFMHEQDIWVNAAMLVAQRRSLDISTTESPKPTRDRNGNWSMSRHQVDRATRYIEDIIRVDDDPAFHLILL